MSVRLRQAPLVDEVPMVGEFVRYVCAFCDHPPDDDPRYAHLTLDWPLSGETQAVGAHTACLRAAFDEAGPLPVE